MRQHLTGLPAKLLLTLVLLLAGCAYERSGVSLVAPAAKSETDGLVLPPGPKLTGPW